MVTMSFGEAALNILRIITFQRRTISYISRNLDATIFALFWIALSGILNVIHSQLTGGIDAIQYLVSPVLLILVTAIIVSILHTVAKLLGGNGSFLNMIRVFGFALPITWILLLPLGNNGLLLVVIWLILLSIHLVAVVHQLSFARATWTIMVPLLIVVLGIISVINFLGENLLVGIF